MKAPSYRNRIVFCMAILSLMTSMATVLAGCSGGKKGYQTPEQTERTGSLLTSDSLRTIV
jgi:hypothetical protein